MTRGGGAGGIKYGGPERRLARDAALAEYRTAIRDTTRLNRLFAILSEPAPLAILVDRVLLALSEMFAADIVALL